MTNPALPLSLSLQPLSLLPPPGEPGNRLWTQTWMRPIFRIPRLVRPRVAPTLIAQTSFRDAKIRRLNFNNTESPMVIEGRCDFRHAQVSDSLFQDTIFEKDIDF